MVLIAGATIWLLISLAFILVALDVHPRVIQAGCAILGLEFVFLAVAAGSAECSGGPCTSEQLLTGATGVPAALITYVLPALTAGFTLSLIAYGLLRHRGAKA
jgi:hypothetical protein